MLGVLSYAAWRKLVDIRSPLVLFAFSFILLPLVVFNQQVVTGMSLQPIHYQVFFANYVALIAVVLVSLIIWRTRYAQRRIPSLALAAIALVAFGWGMLEVSRATEHWSQKAKLRDDMNAVAKRLTAMAKEDGMLQAAFAAKQRSQRCLR